MESYQQNRYQGGFGQLLILSMALKIHKRILTTILIALWYSRAI